MKVKFNVKTVNVKLPEQGDVVIEGLEYEFEGTAGEIRDSIGMMTELVKAQLELQNS